MKYIALLLILLLASCAPSRKACRKNYPCPPPEVVERVEIRDSIIELPGDTTTRTVVIPGPVVNDTRIMWRSPQIQAEDNACARVFIQRVDSGNYIVRTECKPRAVKTEVRTVERVKRVPVTIEAKDPERGFWDTLKDIFAAIGAVAVGVVAVLLFIRLR